MKKSLSKYQQGIQITVKDKMQRNYSYLLEEQPGRNLTFSPQLTPMQMLEMGVFEGHYLTDCTDEFPAEWFIKAKLNYTRPDITLNCFGVKARLDRSEWLKRGWILSPDPRGWFQWYCRYWLGRRIPQLDELQIARWKNFKRHLVQVERNCLPGDILCRPKQRQALLQWAYNPFI
ncbi:hypothetical protein [Candidatus Avelusimicrobium stercoris]|uniref:hypothetical protein n=1 Tax=Candidatus Avelusimicrobium stercoris TaxID=1947924 RepID=UPI003D144A41